MAIVMMCLYPTWNDTFIGASRRVEKPIGYAPIYSPPDATQSTVEVDLTRLALQIAAASALTAVLFVTNGRTTAK